MLHARKPEENLSKKTYAWVDQQLCKIKSWRAELNVCRLNEKRIAAKAKRGSSDFSRFAELGTTVKGSGKRLAEQEIIYDVLERERLTHKHTAEDLEYWLDGLEAAFESLKEIEHAVYEARYLEGKTRDECIRSIQGLSRRSYDNAVRVIRNTALSAFALMEIPA